MKYTGCWGFHCFVFGGFCRAGEGTQSLVHARQALYLWATPQPLWFLLCLFFCGPGDQTQGHSATELYLQPFLFFILRYSFTKLSRLTSWTYNPPASASQVTGITSMHLYTCLGLFFFNYKLIVVFSSIVKVIKPQQKFFRQAKTTAQWYSTCLYVQSFRTRKTNRTTFR